LGYKLGCQPWQILAQILNGSSDHICWDISMWKSWGVFSQIPGIFKYFEKYSILKWYTDQYVLKSCSLCLESLAWFVSPILYIYIDFHCTNDSHCNNHGFCDLDLGNCRCHRDWDLESDCSSKVSILLFPLSPLSLVSFACPIMFSFFRHTLEFHNDNSSR